MAIKFARIEFVKRSSGKNACAKSAYISRSKVEFNGNCISSPNIYDWSRLGSPIFHDVILPENVDEKFKDLTNLWNAAETKEIRSNAQVAMELVLALPDDLVITVEDRIHLTKTFVQEHFVNKGLAAQIAIHSPEKRFLVTGDNIELGLKKGMAGHVVSQTENTMTVKFESGQVTSFNPKEFTGFVEKDHNWHAHILIPTRRFQENGLELDDKKARDMMPRVLKGRVVSGPDWGSLWARHQNNFFRERGLGIQVDSEGITPQEHLGPNRLRAAYTHSLLDEHERRLENNQRDAASPKKVLERLTTNKSIFTKADFEHFISKHTPTENVEMVTKEFWQLPNLIQLVDKKTGELLPKFTSKTVFEEEQKILRLSERLVSQTALPLKPKQFQLPTNLNPEQQETYNKIIHGKRLSLIQGYAGTGKSHALKALQTTYEKAGYKIRAFGPDSATAMELKEKGFSNTSNVHQFLFSLKREDKKISYGKEVWIVDEAGKLANKPLLELLKQAEKNNIQVVLAGDSAQLPPVERGGMFKVLCDRFGSQKLIDIQRQKNTHQRAMVQNLATGEYGAAIDKLSQTKGLIWADSKKEAMQELVLRWAQDTQAYPNTSALIISHSNAEVLVLNELVRKIRQQRGELSNKEYQCMTTQGPICVSVGDHIQFRKNDSSLGVYNGLSGVLIEAHTDRFVIAVEGEGKKKQTVAFNPEKHHAFQLGYASTYYRSQGRTIDRAYVLHSSMLNKQMFYVGLSRHVRDVSYFLSKDEVYCLADLKRLSTRDAEKDLTVEFTTQEVIHKQKGVEERQLHIQDLIGSDSFLNKMKGYGLATLDKVVTATTDVTGRIQDRFPDKAFYSPSMPSSRNKKFPVLELSTPTFINNQNKTLDGIPMALTQPEHDSTLRIDHENLKENARLDSLQKMHTGSSIEPKAINKLPPELRAKFKDYLNHSEQAIALKTMVDVEAENTLKDVRLTAYFRQWQEVCGARNKSAHTVLAEISPNEKLQLNPKTLSIVQEQAQRYEAFLVKHDKSTKHSLEDQLKENIETLLYKLYPEGPTSRDRTHFRFGSKGSMSVAHTGSKVGQFYDFEQQIGGGLLKLIQRERGVGAAEARIWAKSFLDQPSEVSIPASFARSATNSSKDSQGEDIWVSMKPTPETPAPSLENIRGKKLAHYFTEVSRHPYKDVDGQLLYYVLRLQDKQDPKRKMTPPLSYGYWKSKPDQLGWDLKGYKSEQNQLYNLHLLKQNPTDTILIVEGEKTADLALSKLPGEKLVCVTWSGGAGAVSRSDWTPLAGRKVLIWPDNDQAGYQAGEKVCQELRKVGVESLHEVNIAELKKHFPEKWDLADQLPTGISEQLPKKLVAQAVQKGVNPEQVMMRLSLDPKNLTERSRINEILWRVDERVRPGLEEKYGNQPWKIQDEIFKETQRLFLGQEKQKTLFKDKFEMESKAIESLTYQVCLAQAQRGRELRGNEVEIIKDVIQKLGYVSLPKTTGYEVSDIARDRLLSKECEKALDGAPINSRGISEVQQERALTIATTEKQAMHVQSIQNVKKIEISKDHEIRI